MFDYRRVNKILIQQKYHHRNITIVLTSMVCIFVTTFHPATGIWIFVTTYAKYVKR